MKRLKGLIPNMLTPLLENGKPDVPAIHRLVHFLADAGVGGLWVLGSAGEDLHIGWKERVTVAREVVYANEHQIPVIIGAGTASFFEILSFAEGIPFDKIRGIHVLPYDVKMGASQLVQYITKVADSLPCPLWLYHNPKRGRPLTLPIVSELKEHPNIDGIKVGGYSLTELTSTLMLQSERFEVLGAGAGQLFQMLSLGALAHTTSEGSCFPEVFVDLIALFQSGRFDEARKLQFRLIELSQKIPRTENGEYAAEEKYILSKRGICEEYVVPAYRKLILQEKKQIDKALREFGFPWA